MHGQALHPGGRLDDVVYLQRELLRALEEKRAVRGAHSALEQGSGREKPSARCGPDEDLRNLPHG